MFIKRGALSLTSDTRTIIGILRRLFDVRIVHETCKKKPILFIIYLKARFIYTFANNNIDKLLIKRFKSKKYLFKFINLEVAFKSNKRREAEKKAERWKKMKSWFICKIEMSADY